MANIKIIIRPYVHDIDHSGLKGAIANRDLQLSLEDLPKIGFIARIDDQFIACGFLRRIEGKSGMIDSFLSHPHIDAEIRNEALNLITIKLINKAKQLKLKGLIASTKDKNTLVRACSHGFLHLLDHSLMALKLS